MQEHVELGIEEERIGAIVDDLTVFLADSYALYLKSQSYHWNVTGPHFHSLHALFEEQYTELAASIDVIAERIRSLGAGAPGSFSAFEELRTLPDAADDLDETAMVKDLMRGHEHLSQHAKQYLERAEEAGDEGTVDLYVQRMAAHEKAAWMLRSSLPD